MLVLTRRRDAAKNAVRASKVTVDALFVFIDVLLPLFYLLAVVAGNDSAAPDYSGTAEHFARFNGLK
jgi:hypothetical protein